VPAGTELQLLEGVSYPADPRDALGLRTMDGFHLNLEVLRKSFIVICRQLWIPFLCTASGVFVVARADDSSNPAASQFATRVAPFLAEHCTRCHGGKEPEAELALDRYQDSSNIQQDIELWEKVQRMIEARQMPPSDEPQPTDAEVQAVLAGIESEMERFDCSSERHPGRVTLRRLNRVEYNNTIRDLVGVDFRPADDFPADDVGNGFDNIGDVLSLPPVLFEKYLAAAERVIAEAFARDDLRQRILVHQPQNEDDHRAALRRNIADFATRAFRRPVTDDEVDRLYQLRRAARANGKSDDEAIQVPLQAILTSPHFLFRVELDPARDDPDGIRELTAFEVATRLSYFLWSTMPDEELFAAARDGKLLAPGVLEEQAARMLRDSRARALVENFAGQWLQLRDLERLAPDPERFPSFDEELRAAMLQETQTFLEAMIRDDRSVLDFLTADYTFVNERLAKHYGIPGVSGPDFRRVETAGARRGVLTQASILLLTSNPTRTSPVKRGKWILENVLGAPPPPPPANVPELTEEGELLGTLRERMEQHRSDASCAVCHQQMDTLGFGLENFDAIGAWRDRDGRFEIDPAGMLPGGAGFNSPAELMEILAERKKNDFCRCLTEKMLTYALGRGLESFDRCTVRQIQHRLAEHDFRFSALVTGIVTSDPFLAREARGEP
jgi:hypothetical protein